MAGKHARNPRHRGRHRKPPSVAQRALPTGTAVAVLAVGGVIFGNAIANGQSPSHPGSTAPTPRPSVSVLGLQITRPAVDAPKPHQHHATRQHSPAALRIADTGSRCYVQVTNRHGHIMMRRILDGHQHVSFRHHGLDVVLGNAGAVRVSVNGAHARRVGSEGQVRRFHVG